MVFYSTLPTFLEDQIRKYLQSQDKEKVKPNSSVERKYFKVDKAPTEQGKSGITHSKKLTKGEQFASRGLIQRRRRSESSSSWQSWRKSFLTYQGKASKGGDSRFERNIELGQKHESQ